MLRSARRNAHLLASVAAAVVGDACVVTVVAGPHLSTGVRHGLGGQLEAPLANFLLGIFCSLIRES